MRVVAGTAKGRRLQGPLNSDLRPTSDRVREAMFDVLISLGAVEGASVADLFAGTGALGVEALSRGALSAFFVDHDAMALESIKVNLVTTGLYAKATVVQADVLTWAAGADKVDLAFADPPYAFDDWATLLARLDADLLVAESNRDIEVGDGWKVLKSKHYGGTVVTMADTTRSRA
jgi:16S rRNA (guanine966-N2)-methyltransferase